MVQEFEDNIIPPLVEIRDGWKPTLIPRKKVVVPGAALRTKIEGKSKSLKEYTKSFKIGVNNDTDPFKQNTGTRKAIQYRLAQLLGEMKGLKFVETLIITFEKISQDVVIDKQLILKVHPKQ